MYLNMLKFPLGMSLLLKSKPVRVLSNTSNKGFSSVAVVQPDRIARKHVTPKMKKWFFLFCIINTFNA